MTWIEEDEITVIWKWYNSCFLRSLGLLLKLGTDLVNEAPGHVTRGYLFLYSITLLRSVYLKGKSSTRLVLAVPYVKQFTKKQWSELIPEKPGEFTFVLRSDRVYIGTKISWFSDFLELVTGIYMCNIFRISATESATIYFVTCCGGALYCTVFQPKPGMFTSKARCYKVSFEISGEGEMKIDVG